MTPQQVEAVLQAADARTWAGLVGSTWDFIGRVLHPAHRRTAQGVAPVHWSELPGAEGVDLARAAWHEVSGVRLHTGRSGSGWDLEPVVGPGEGDVLSELVPLLTGQDADAAVWLAQWRDRGRPATAGAPGELIAHRREYDVVRLSAAEVLHGLSDPSGGPLPDLLWSADGSWIAHADIDLPCTVVGCSHESGVALLASPSLEVVPVEPAAAIRA